MLLLVQIYVKVAVLKGNDEKLAWVPETSLPQSTISEFGSDTTSGSEPPQKMQKCDTPNEEK